MESLYVGGHVLMPGHRKPAEIDFRNAELQMSNCKYATVDQGLADLRDLPQKKHVS